MSSDPSFWQLPNHEVREFSPRRAAFAVLGFVINKGERVGNQLFAMQVQASARDTNGADGGSTGGSLEPSAIGAAWPGFHTTELTVTHANPATSMLSPVRWNLGMLRTLCKAVSGSFNPAAASLRS
jgi:hypothetical protein